jgi:hypothetical protein
MFAKLLALSFQLSAPFALTMLFPLAGQCRKLTAES